MDGDGHGWGVFLAAKERKNRFFAVFGGMEMAHSVLCDKNSFVNPNGIGSFSPATVLIFATIFWMFFHSRLVRLMWVSSPAI
jgi:hypothetical protein